MSVKIQCPQCREKYDAGNEYIGRRFRCKCNAIIAVPDLDEILNAPDGDGNVPTGKKSEAGVPPAISSAPTFYGFLALVCGTSGALAILNFFIVSVAACTSPIFDTPQENACVAAASILVALLVFLSSAVFRVADLAVRRSGTRYFF